MKVFLDCAEVDKVAAIHSEYPFDGLTTNPRLIAKCGRKLEDVISEMCAIVDCPVSAQVTSGSVDSMVAQGVSLSKIAKNVVIKVPVTKEGLIACKEFTRLGIKTNMTMCFSVVQAFLAANHGATYISIFVGRSEDKGVDGLDLLEKVVECYGNYNFQTEILAASVRNLHHIEVASSLGVDCVTLSPELFKKIWVNETTMEACAQLTAEEFLSKPE